MGVTEGVAEAVGVLVVVLVVRVWVTLNMFGTTVVRWPEGDTTGRVIVREEVVS